MALVISIAISNIYIGTQLAGSLHSRRRKCTVMISSPAGSWENNVVIESQELQELPNLMSGYSPTQSSMCG